MRLILEWGEFIKQAHYVGNCVEIGDDSNPELHRIFSDATEFATMVGDEDDPGYSIEISKELFDNHVPSANIPPSALDGLITYHYIDTGNYGPEGARIFILYNVDQDIHYIFSK